jgi:uncharacterized membrane protein
VKFAWRTEAVSIGLLGIMALLAMVSWAGAPDRIPVHWNLAGDVDRYGGKFEGLAGLPLVAMAVYAILLVAPRFDPRRAHYDAFVGPYAVIRTAVVALLFGIYLMLHLVMRGQAVPVSVIVPIGIGLLCVVIGAYLPRVQSNWFVGVRTPWTLSSEEAWTRTHHLAGWLLMATGAVTVMVTLLRPRWAVGALAGGGFATAVICVVYSYLVWKRDPARTGA